MTIKDAVLQMLRSGATLDQVRDELKINIQAIEQMAGYIKAMREAERRP